MHFTPAPTFKLCRWRHCIENDTTISTQLPKRIIMSKYHPIPWDTGPKLHLFSRDSGKDAVRGPPKLPKGEARGRHLFKIPKGKGGVLTLLTGFAGFPLYI